MNSKITYLVKLFARFKKIMLIRTISAGYLDSPQEAVALSNSCYQYHLFCPLGPRMVLVGGSSVLG